MASLFTFDIEDVRLKDIPGVVVKEVAVEVVGSNLRAEGPLLITHVGLSAPAILKLSAYGAIELAERAYNFKIKVNFTKHSSELGLVKLKQFKIEYAKRQVHNTPLFEIPKRLWHKLVEAAFITKKSIWADIDKKQLENLNEQLTQTVFHVTGKVPLKKSL